MFWPQDVVEPTPDPVARRPVARVGAAGGDLEVVALAVDHHDHVRHRANERAELGVTFAERRLRPDERPLAPCGCVGCGGADCGQEEHLGDLVHQRRTTGVGYRERARAHREVTDRGEEHDEGCVFHDGNHGRDRRALGGARKRAGGKNHEIRHPDRGLHGQIGGAHEAVASQQRGDGRDIDRDVGGRQPRERASLPVQEQVLTTRPQKHREQDADVDQFEAVGQGRRVHHRGRGKHDQDHHAHAVQEAFGVSAFLCQQCRGRLTVGRVARCGIGRYRHGDRPREGVLGEPWDVLSGLRGVGEVTAPTSPADVPLTTGAEG